jgi:SAM-dependent methyltransferase
MPGTSADNRTRRLPGSVFALAIFLSSSLLFLTEPVAGKRILPLLGGSAAVWTACLVFFQCALLLGYFAAHWLATRVSTRAQLRIYLALLALSFAQLLLALNLSLHASNTRPITSVLWLLTILIGLPFVTLSATSPLLQSWYARASSGGSSRAYRLFAVSNVGSLLALVIYPWIIEPRVSLHGQGTVLAIGFAGLALVCGTIAYALRGMPGAAEAAPAEFAPELMVEGDSARRQETVGDRVLWVAFAACGSLLLSAVTNHLSQNVATIPLLWIIPLVVYLLTFVIAFSGSGDGVVPRWLGYLLALAGLGGAGYYLYQGDLFSPILRVVSTFTASLFALCLFCHAELYRRRPAPARLTTFYFSVAAGGALGAIFVGIVAPYALIGTYELAGGLAFAAVLALVVAWPSGLPMRVFWSAVVTAAVLLIGRDVKADRENAFYRTRNFYGDLHISQNYYETYKATARTLYHGVIEHGQQVFSPALRNEPTTYYGHKTGVGLSIDLCCGDRPRRIGVIGLGTGTIAAYGRPGDVIRFYDINPAVPPIAQRYFTYLRDSKAKIEIVPGDARISMENEPPQSYDVIAIDAFSGDAIPVHLITSEALELYKRHIKPGGIIAFHVSNRFLRLQPVVKQLADHAGMHSVLISSADDEKIDVFSSDWVLVTNSQSFLAHSELDDDREDIVVPPRLRRWTDDYNSLLPILRFKHDST